MTDALRVNVRKGTEKLIDVDFDLQYGHSGLHLVEESRGAVDRLWHKFKDEIKVDLFFLRRASAKRMFER